MNTCTDCNELVKYCTCGLFRTDDKFKAVQPVPEKTAAQVTVDGVVKEAVEELEKKTDYPYTLLIEKDEPNPVIRALNNAYYLIDENKDEEEEGVHDAVANAVLHEILRAIAEVRRQTPEKATEMYEGYVPFNPNAECSPTLTQCPRCNNPHNACDSTVDQLLAKGKK